MSLREDIERITTKLKEGLYTNEAAVSQGIILPVLNSLGWPVFDTSIVCPEYTLENRRVDYALCHPANKPKVFLEVKRVGLANGADRQLFEYAFHQGVQIAVLSDGVEWSIYLPAQPGRYDERRVYKLDLLERKIEESCDRLTRYLEYSRICSGSALEAARLDYEDVARDREIESNLPKAWKALLREKDESLLEILAVKVEDLCGYKPDLDICGQFLSNIDSMPTPRQVTATQISKPSPVKHTSYHAPERRFNQTGYFDFKYKGQLQQAGSAVEAMVLLFQLIGKDKPDFYNKFASRKHGRKRRYLARTALELYPDRPDLANSYSVEIAPNWWMSTNHSRSTIQKIIYLALEVAGPDIEAQVNIKVV